MANNSRQGGWLAMEALLAIVISSVMVASAVGIYASSEKSIYKEQVAIGISELGENINKGFSTRSSYAGISERIVRDLGLMPDVFVSGGPDGADLSVSPGPDNSFDISVAFAGKSVAQQWCADLLPNGSRRWIATGAGNAPGEGLLPDMDVEKAVAACKGSSVFTFRGM